MRIFRLLILLAGISAMSAGYFLLYNISPESEVEMVLKHTKIAMFLNISGGALLIIYLFSRSR